MSEQKQPDSGSVGVPLRREIFLISLAAILLEVSYTRIFSFKLVYYFTYVIIGIALLGLGVGAIAVALTPALRKMRPSLTVGWCALMGAGAILLSYFVVALVQVNAVALIEAISFGLPRVVVGEGIKLGLLCLSLFIPFLTVGVAIALILSTYPQNANKLYFADLVGAGLGCAAVVPLMKVLTPPGVVMMSGVILCLAAWKELRGKALLPLLPLLVATAVPSLLPDPVTDEIKTMSPQRHRSDVVFSQWDPVFRVDATQYGPDALRLIHDGMWGSLLPKFNGDVESLTRYDNNIRALPFSVLPPRPDVVIVGSAGGNEIYASLRRKAKRIRGVELNPVTVSLLTDHFADFAGHVTERPDVEVHNAEGRSFVTRMTEPVDLIWFVAPDSYAAMNSSTSGAFVLSESYLYTVEMIEVAMQRLTDDGVVCAQFGEYDLEKGVARTGRYLASAREAFRRMGIDDFRRHVMVSTGRGFFTSSTILLSRTPFSEDDARDFGAAVKAMPNGKLRYSLLERDSELDELTIIDLPEAELADWFAASPVSIDPITDDGPFFWHFVRFRDALWASPDGSLERGLGEKLLLMLLVVVTLFALTFVALPIVVRRDLWRSIPHKASAGVFFAALGMGFMLIEVTLIQRLTLFLGYPTYSLSITLFSILIFTGIGSMLSDRFERPQQLLPAMLGVLFVLVLFYAFGLGPLVESLIGTPFPVRVALCLVILAPLGLCLGTFMPLGLRTVAGWSDHSQEYVAWAWAVNGFFSVISSVGATILAMAYGFTVVILCAMALYVIGTVSLLRVAAAK